nr:PREDICTED: protein-cysteine N-palmitoyltransferase Rasp [Bemisia tabaci]
MTTYEQNYKFLKMSPALSGQAKLPGIEIRMYLISWIAATTFALYQLYAACQQYCKNYFCQEIFEDGWPVLNMKIDRTDYEWNLWTKLIFRLLPWFGLHLVGAEIFRKFSLRITLIWYTAVTVLCISYLTNFHAVLLILAQFCLYYLLLRLKSISLIWIFFFISTVYQYSIMTQFLPKIHEDQFHVIFVILSWSHLRCISFTSFLISSKTSSNFIFLLGYCFYLPCFTLGPIILYPDFISNVERVESNFFPRFLKASISFLRYSFWYYFTEFGLHFIYIGAFPHHYGNLNLNPWAMCGLGFAMGMFFYLKYLVVYGVAGSVITMEGYDPPSPPRCIACIHLYSHMWRYFDTGLHKFIKSCIYKPLSDTLENFVSGLLLSSLVSLICFSFIFLWHGLHKYVLIWSSLNFVGLVIELGCKKLSTSKRFCYYQDSILSRRNQRRMYALLAAPLTVMSAVSNFYFIGEGEEVGFAFVSFLLKSSTFAKVALLLSMYTLSQISTEYVIKKKKL